MRQISQFRWRWLSDWWLHDGLKRLLGEGEQTADRLPTENDSSPESRSIASFDPIGKHTGKGEANLIRGLNE